jgi:hypothetical protein
MTMLVVLVIESSRRARVCGRTEEGAHQAVGGEQGREDDAWRARGRGVVMVMTARHSLSSVRCALLECGRHCLGCAGRVAGAAVQ